YFVIASMMAATVGANSVAAQTTLPEWQQMSHRLTEGRTFAFVVLVEATTNMQSENLGGVVLFQAGESTSTKTRLRVFDTLRYGTLDELSALKLPRSSRFLAGTVVVNPFRGVKNGATVDGELPYLLGQTCVWIFPRMPLGVGKQASHEGYVTHTKNVKSPSYYNWDATATGETNGVVRIEDRRVFKSNDDGQTYNVSGQGWFDFDKRDRLVSQRVYQGTHTIDGVSTAIVLYIKRLTDDQLRELARNG
ncbi:hypothetical protein OAS39_00005, partial [Pirellulales bacterium]|nr:hypothetical protein [Pirellulales bacterium]